MQARYHRLRPTLNDRIVASWLVGGNGGVFQLVGTFFGNVFQVGEDDVWSCCSLLAHV